MSVLGIELRGWTEKSTCNLYFHVLRLSNICLYNLFYHPNMLEVIGIYFVLLKALTIHLKT